MKSITIYTDGACRGNPGPGGWGAILVWNNYMKEISGGESHTTNNRMELTAVISAFKRITEPCEVDVYSDSTYVVYAFQKGWLDGWRESNFTKKKKPVKNMDLWQELIDVVNGHTVRFHWVKGHASNEFNNRCDELAVARAREY